MGHDMPGHVGYFLSSRRRLEHPYAPAVGNDHEILPMALSDDPLEETLTPEGEVT